MVYECAICGTEHDRLIDRIECETKCYEKIKAEEEEKRKAELAAAEKSRKEEVDLAYKKYLELRGAYLKDYGHYTYSFINNNQSDSTNSASAWENFWRNL